MPTENLPPVSPEDEAVWKAMWIRKDEGREMFAQAELLVDVEGSEWNGTHPVEKNERKYTMKAGSTVLITMASRFGDVGIRGTDIDEESHGYHARVLPEMLRNPRFLSDGGTPWRKQMMEKLGMWKEPDEPDPERPKPEDFTICLGPQPQPQCQPAAGASRKKKRARSKS